MLDEKKYKTKTYIHFDHRVKIDSVESYVTDENKVSVHSFLPLIHYTVSFEKFNQKKYQNKELIFLDEKKRDIKYAGHLDNHIYKYYSEKIQCDFYNKWCLDNDLDESVLAYRNNKEGQSNIHFAAEVISKIVEIEEAYVLVGDFTQYFDKINHLQLKKKVQEVLKVKRLTADWFNVFQSVTKYGYYEKELLDEIFGSTKELKKKKKRSYFNKLSEFRTFKATYKKELVSNKLSRIGIPQGTAISATFANIYAIDFDRIVNKLTLSHGGIYRRYSDDFIAIFPKRNFRNIQEFLEVEELIRLTAEKENIEIQESKTDVFEYTNHKVTNLKKHANNIDYLGFIFDGISVQMRGKGPYKFYRKAEKLILKAEKTKKNKKLKKLPYRKSIYKLYTDLGINEDHGNYISYAKKSQEVFDNVSKNTNNLMMNQIKNRKRFIEKKAGIKLSIKL